MRARRIRPATTSGGLRLRVAEVQHTEHDDLVGNVAEHLGIEIRLRRFERQVRRDAALELVEERIAGEAVVDDVRVPEAGVQHGVAVDPVERAIDRLEGVLASRLRSGLEIRLVDLDDVGALPP